MKSAVQQLKEDEGFRGNVYKCSAGKNTIGYGRNLDDNPLTKYEAEFLLNSDLEKIVDSLSDLPFYPRLSPRRRGVVINMTYNLGLPRFKQFKRMIAAMYLCDYELAAVEMLDSKWAKQVGDRAIRLAEIMRDDGFDCRLARQ
jgi:lysozyme